MQYLLLALAVITSGISGVCYKKVSLASGNRSASAVLPVLWYLPLAIVFGILALFTGGIFVTAEILLPALLAGVAAVICGYSLLESMKSNSYSLAIIIVNLSFVFPVVLSILFLRETAHTLQLFGMLLAVAMVLLLNLGKGNGKSTASALILAICSSFGNGLIDFAIKLQQYQMPGEGTCSFFFLTYLFAAALTGAVYLILRGTGHTVRVYQSYGKELRLNAPGIVLCNGMCFFFVSVLAGWMNAAAEFTVITSLSIFFSLLIGWIRMKERLGKRELLSLLFGAAAIACQSLNLLS